jgi:hypothetical protein
MTLAKSRLGSAKKTGFRQVARATNPLSRVGPIHAAFLFTSDLFIPADKRHT